MSTKKMNNQNLDDMLLDSVPKKIKKCSIVVSSRVMTEGHKKQNNLFG